MSKSRSQIMDAKSIDQALTRMAHEVLERNGSAENLAVIGIRTAGVYLAQRLAAKVKHLAGREVKIGILDITLYRDDVRSGEVQPQVRETKINFALNDLNVVLVDDVLFTGRSIRSALDELIDFGRPREIQLAVLVDRGHRELPIRADYVGKNVPTSHGERVTVLMTEKGDADGVWVEKED